MINQEISSLGKLLSVSFLRHQITAHNIANLNTDGYKRKTVEFEKFLDTQNLRESIQKTKIEITEEEETDRIDGNSTSLEKEVQELMHNNLKQQVYIQALTHKIKNMQGAILGRF